MSALRALRSDRAGRAPVEEKALKRDVAEGVDVALPVVVVVEPDVVLGEAVVVAGSIVMWWSAGSGTSMRASVSSGWLSVMVVPLRTSRAAAATRAGVRWFRAPRSPPSSQRPQFETASKSSRNSCAVTSTPGILPEI